MAGLKKRGNKSGKRRGVGKAKGAAPPVSATVPCAADVASTIAINSSTHLGNGVASPSNLSEASGDHGVAHMVVSGNCENSGIANVVKEVHMHVVQGEEATVVGKRVAKTDVSSELAAAKAELAIKDRKLEELAEASEQMAQRQRMLEEDVKQLKRAEEERMAKQGLMERRASGLREEMETKLAEVEKRLAESERRLAESEEGKRQAAKEVEELAMELSAERAARKEDAQALEDARRETMKAQEQLERKVKEWEGKSTAAEKQIEEPVGTLDSTPTKVKEAKHSGMLLKMRVNEEEVWMPKEVKGEEEEDQEERQLFEDEKVWGRAELSATHEKETAPLAHFASRVKKQEGDLRQLALEAKHRGTDSALVAAGADAEELLKLEHQALSKQPNGTLSKWALAIVRGLLLAVGM